MAAGQANYKEEKNLPRYPRDFRKGLSPRLNQDQSDFGSSRRSTSFSIRFGFHAAQASTPRVLLRLNRTIHLMNGKAASSPRKTTPFQAPILPRARDPLVTHPTPVVTPGRDRLTGFTVVRPSPIKRPFAAKRNDRSFPYTARAQAQPSEGAGDGSAPSQEPRHPRYRSITPPQAATRSL